ncbi:ATP-binding protein [Nonomuraea endophytica]|uniref:Anti-sigma regulatory factor (Ser/Thr protein kinase) n=1 Tax=Nonomuraea endophytica TaxID=714136 RepID=A0A7W8AI59_9ACTN|nr:ATP-binding protein [Nonomuraea endophytica]MBB5085308.1 anti-sigma regulatory factor (Ser/Thr protein kinase) [Nonomuraea endophytica]
MSSTTVWPVSDDLAGLRLLVDTYARRAGLASRQREDLKLAVNEAVTNVLDHAGGRGEVRLRIDDEHLTVDICDKAGLLAPDAFPAQLPEIDGLARKPGSFGVGLWLMRQVCDEATITQQAGESRVSLRMRRTES